MQKIKPICKARTKRLTRTELMDCICRLSGENSELMKQRNELCRDLAAVNVRLIQLNERAEGADRL